MGKMKDVFVNALCEITEIEQSIQPHVPISPVCSHDMIFQLML